MHPASPCLGPAGAKTAGHSALPLLLLLLLSRPLHTGCCMGVGRRQALLLLLLPGTAATLVLMRTCCRLQQT
jgi:hypothetical protein